MNAEPTDTLNAGHRAHRAGAVPASVGAVPRRLLGLKVFETRYLDLISRCMRSSQGFGVVALRSGSEMRLPGSDQVELEAVGVLAEILDVDSPGSGILHVRCRGTRRFAAHAVAQQIRRIVDGTAEWLPADPVVGPGEALQACSQALVTAVDTLHAQGARPFLEPMRFDDAGWVANRWCEILPIPTEAKHRLMALDEPLIRLGLVDEFLRQNGVIG